MHGFLPTTRDEMNAAGLSQLDFILITGDAYVDRSWTGWAEKSVSILNRERDVG